MPDHPIALAESADRPRAIVALERVDDDVRAAVRRAMDNAEWKRFVTQGRDVALKVNLGWQQFIPGSITSPLVAEAVIEAIRAHVGRIFVIEADQVLEQVEPAFRDSGMAEVCRRTRATWLNMSHAPVEIVECPNNRVFKRIAVPSILRSAQLISLPVMKTHAKTGITGALKNQWACLPMTRHHYHPVLDDALADLASVIRPTLSLMDGTIGLEGNGPKSGRPRIANRLLCSGDPVALDTIQALSMGIEPSSVGHLATCAARGVGTNDLTRIDVRGLDPVRDRVPFRPAAHNLVSEVETRLRKSRLEPLIFRTPLLRLCLLSASLYYEIWTRRRAPEYWRICRAHPVYGPQWRSVGPFRASE